MILKSSKNKFVERLKERSINLIKRLKSNKKLDVVHQVYFVLVARDGFEPPTFRLWA